jgi:hypothetical protein
MYLDIGQNEYFSRKRKMIPRGVIRSRNSKKDRQYNVQKKKGIRTNNDLQNTAQKVKDRSTQ